MELLTAGFQPERVIHYVSRLVDENEVTKWRRIILRISWRIRCKDQPLSISEAQVGASECRRRTAGFSGLDFGHLGDLDVSLAASTFIIYHPPNIIVDYGIRQVGPVGELF